MHHHIFPLLLILTLSSAVPPPPPPQLNLILPSDAVAILSFKSKADQNNKLLYIINERFDHCHWQGVKCAQGRVVRYVLQSFSLRGIFSPNTLTNLDQLRVLSLRNNSLSGPIPDLSGLVNLKTLLLDHNLFSGTFPLSVLNLHRVHILGLANNNLSGHIPVELNKLDRLKYLRLDFNRFNGTFPPLNLSLLNIFNVSGNNLTGEVPVTQTLSRFNISSFLFNPDLCGKILNKTCRLNSSTLFNSPPPQVIVSAPLSCKKHTNNIGVILAFVIGALVLVAAFLCIIACFKNRRRQRIEQSEAKIANFSAEPQDTNVNESSIVMRTSTSELQNQRRKSGNLIFCNNEPPFCNLDQLMGASAELLGRGTIGITYKAVMYNQITVTVKRLDAVKTANTSNEAFERHMDTVGLLRHPNLVPVKGYSQASQEKLIVYEFQPNGSLFNLIYGSRSARAKPLHWTSCLKLAEDVAMGLAYIHQASRLSHGNLKSSNILLGADFEARLTDYCLSILADSTSIDDANYRGYKAPEIRKSNHHATTNSDVFAFGILLLELLTGKPPSQHLSLGPNDIMDWVTAMRNEEEEDTKLKMLVELAGFCSLTSPEQRPSMRQVIKMIQEIKEAAVVDENLEESNF
ncbi:hypothetical protein ACET3Z_026943 [Daucus carota]